MVSFIQHPQIKVWTKQVAHVSPVEDVGAGIKEITTTYSHLSEHRVQVCGTF